MKIRKQKNSLQINKTPNIERIYQLVLAIILYIFTLFILSPNYIQKISPPKVGELVTQPFIVKRTVRYQNKAETEIRRDYVKGVFTPIFDENSLVEGDAVKKLKDIFSFIRVSYDNKVNINTMYNGFLNRFKLPINQSTFQNIVLYGVDLGYEEKSEKILKTFFKDGVLSKKNLTENTLKLILNNGIVIQKIDEYLNEERAVKKENVNILETLDKNMTDIVLNHYPFLDYKDAENISLLISSLLKENISYNATKSEDTLNSLVQNVKPVYTTAKKGYAILKTGDIVTEEKADLIRYVYGGVGVYNIVRFVSGSLFVLLIFFSIGFIIFYYKLNFLNDIKKYTLAVLEYILIMSIIYLIYNYVVYNFINIYIPFYIYSFIPLFAIINTMLGSRRGISNTITICMVFLSSVITQSTVAETFILFSASIFSSVMSQNISRRTGIVYLGMIIGLIFVFGTIITGISSEVSVNIFIILLSFLSGIFQAVIVTILLPLCEYLLGTATIFRLQELSDLNNPILRQLQMKAPGTYHHSVSMGSLVETIAEEIGENARLACVSAYYHDIGKMENPLYFIENTTRKENRHKNLKPTLSASIVKSHVRIGVEIAKKYKLPKEVIDAIKEHHGTSLIKYFYIEALNENQNVDKTLFIYPGPRPQSKITAVIMLLDSIEAASRTLDAPKKDDLERLIKNIVSEKMMSGELDDSGLTLKDIDTIERIAFQKIIISFHERIVYPEMPDSDKHDKNEKSYKNDKLDKQEKSDIIKKESIKKIVKK